MNLSPACILTQFYYCLWLLLVLLTLLTLTLCYALMCYAMCIIVIKFTIYNSLKAYGLGSNRYTFCQKCFNDIPGDTVTLGDDPTQAQT